MTSHKTMVGNINSETLAFTAGRDIVLDRALVAADCIGSAAHVTMLSKLRLTPPLFTHTQARRVIAELVRIMKDAEHGRFDITPADQDVHLAVERVLTRKLGELGRKIHTARSRNDQVAVDLRLYAREELLAIMTSALALADVLLAFAQKHASVPMVGRTHLQPAMPSSVGLWVSAHAESLLDDLTVMDAAAEVNNRCPLGSAAGYGVALAIDRNLTARLLGFREPIQNVLYASNARGKCEAVILSALSQVMLSLSRLAEDLILYSMPEFGYFILPPEFCTGSSIMPQKNNPDILELVRAKTGRVLAHAAAVASIVKNLPGGYNRDLQETKEPLMEGLRETHACLRILALLAARLKVNRPALRAGFSPSVFATDRVLELVREGRPFRDAYQHVKDHLDELGRRDPAKALAARTHLGAPGRLGLDALRKRVNRKKKFVTRARNTYDRAVSKLLGVRYPFKA